MMVDVGGKDCARRKKTSTRKGHPNQAAYKERDGACPVTVTRPFDSEIRELSFFQSRTETIVHSFMATRYPTHYRFLNNATNDQTTALCVQKAALHPITRVGRPSRNAAMFSTVCPQNT